jgi:hypothetical protein
MGSLLGLLTVAMIVCAGVGVVRWLREGWTDRSEIRRDVKRLAVWQARYEDRKLLERQHAQKLEWARNPARTDDNKE